VKYSVLNYAAGPNQYLDESGQRIPLEDILGPDNAITPSYIPTEIGVHSGEDVGIWASGPQSHLFTGVMQQHTIPHLMAYASCVGSGKKVCGNLSCVGNVTYDSLVPIKVRLGNNNFLL